MKVGKKRGNKIVFLLMVCGMVMIGDGIERSWHVGRQGRKEMLQYNVVQVKKVQWPGMVTKLNENAENIYIYIGNAWL